MTNGDAQRAHVQNLVGTIDLFSGTRLAGTRFLSTFQPSLFSALSSNDRDPKFSAAVVLKIADSVTYHKSRNRSLAHQPCCLQHCQIYGLLKIEKYAASRPRLLHCQLHGSLIIEKSSPAPQHCCEQRGLILCHQVSRPAPFVISVEPLDTRSRMLN